MMINMKKRSHNKEGQSDTEAIPGVTCTLHDRDTVWVCVCVFVWNINIQHTVPSVSADGHQRWNLSCTPYCHQCGMIHHTQTDKTYKSIPKTRTYTRPACTNEYTKSRTWNKFTKLFGERLHRQWPQYVQQFILSPVTPANALVQHPRWACEKCAAHVAVKCL